MRIRWTDPAARDLTHICDYILEAVVSRLSPEDRKWEPEIKAGAREVLR